MPIERQYALFAGAKYYPDGGADDFREFGASVDELKAAYKRKFPQMEKEWISGGWGMIADVSTMQVVCRCDDQGKWMTDAD